MKKLSKLFSFISALCIVFLFSFAFYYIWTAGKRAMLRSCVYSISSDVVEHSNEITNYSRNAGNWYILTDAEAKSVFSNERINFGGCSFFKSQPQDLTERNPKIAVKKHGEQGFEVMVWSKGFDNISGTEDDISSSRDEKIPD